MELTEAICSLAAASENCERSYSLLQDNHHSDFFTFFWVAEHAGKLEAILELQSQVEGFKFIEYVDAEKTRSALDTWYLDMLRCVDRLHPDDLIWIKDHEPQIWDRIFRARAFCALSNR